MGTKKLQGADGMNFQLQLTIKGLESINLPEENLTNESGNDIMKISCWGGKLSAYVNLPNAIRPNNVQPFQLSDCIKIELVRNQVIEHMRSYLQKHLNDLKRNRITDIRQEGREPFEFSEQSDGYSSVIYIVSDLILRMDKNWLLDEEISQYNAQGIVLIDELETHLHIELQKKILPFLTKFFPNIQFIVTTHSPYILNSISNTKAYDLEKHVELKKFISEN